jgi:hypothetical protein
MMLKMLTFAALIAMPTPSATRVVHFASGQAEIAKHGAFERVVIKGRHGEVESESYCGDGSGTYDEIVRLATALKAAARHDDRNAIMAHVAYPLRVNAPPGAGFEIRSKRALAVRLRSVLGRKLIQAISRSEPHAVFCRDGMSMLADGVMWASVDAGVLRVRVVNRK